MSTNNAITVIAPYWWEGTWVFDDPAVGLVREPFVSGIPAIIDHLVTEIPNARSGVRLLFSPTPFPGYQQLAELDREEWGGAWYRTDDPPAEGWLCPALFCYFEVAPDRLFVRAEPLGDKPESGREVAE